MAALEGGAAGGAGGEPSPPPPPGQQEEAAAKNWKVAGWSKEEDDLIGGVAWWSKEEEDDLIGGVAWWSKEEEDDLIGGGDGEKEKPTPVCLPLFPLTPGFHHQKQATAPAPPPLAVTSGFPMPEFLVLFPLTPGM